MSKLHANLALIDQRRADWADSIDLKAVTTEALADEFFDRFWSDELIRELLEEIGSRA